MNGWNTIKEVRTELSEALKLAKAGNKSTAAACMKHAKHLLTQYCKDKIAPGHGFDAEVLGS